MLKIMFRRQAYYYASAVFLLLGFVYFLATTKQVYIGLEIANVKGQWIVISSDSLGEGYKSGIRTGDVILKIDNNDPGEYRFVKKWNEVEGASTFEVRKKHQLNDQMITIPDLPISENSLSVISYVILGSVFWFSGFITWYRRPFLAQARALFWLNWFIGLAIVLAPASSRDLLFAKELELIVFSAVPIFLINFVSYFSLEKIGQVNRCVRHMLTIMFIFIVVLTVMQSVGIVHLISSLRKLVLATMSIGILLTLWNLVGLVKIPNDNLGKNQINILLLGMSIGFLPFVLLTAVPIIYGVRPIMDAHISSLFVSVIPATWYFAIVNIYLPDSRRLFGIIISYFGTGLILSLVIFYLNFALKLKASLNHELYLSTLTLLVVFIACFYLIRVVISMLVDKYLFPEGKQTFKKQILELNGRLSTIDEEDRILDEVVKSLAIDGAFIALEDGKGGFIKNSVGRFLAKPSEQADLMEYYLAHKSIHLDVIMLPSDFPAEVYISFLTKSFNCGIFLGHRIDRVKFEHDAIPYITMIASQLAQRFQTRFVIKELAQEIKFLNQRSINSQRRNQGFRGLTNSLFSSLEKERKGFAREIHDGPLQLALDLNRWLKYLVEVCSTEEEHVKVISHMQELLEDLNIELRLMCNNLRPPSLTDLGLLPAIELLCSETMFKELLKISLETVGIRREQRFKEELELVAYRFVQEGITNTVKHSGSTSLKINIAMYNGSIELSIEDFGQGFDTCKIDDCSLTGTHLGIAGMKERIEELSGDLQISSTIGGGVILKAIIPIS